MRAIDANELIKKMVHPEIEINDGQDLANWYMQCVKKAPTKDVEPVRYGRWVPNSLETHWKCSECGNPAPDCEENGGEVCEWLSGYCPHCGAKMDGGADND